MGPEIIDWFIERGAKFDLYTSGIHPVKRGHAVGGEAYSGSGTGYTDILMRELSSVGVEVMLETKAIEVLTGDRGAIIGVKARYKDGSHRYIKARSVILGTGGNAHAFELIQRYNPEAINRETIHGSFCTGDGIIIAQQLDAGLEGFGDLSFGKGDADGVAIFEGTQEVEQFIGYYSWVGLAPRSFIFVNENGKRYADETLGYQGVSGLEINNQRNAVGICVLDQAMYDDPGYFAYASSGSKERLAMAVESGRIKCSETLSGLAERLGIRNIENFLSTVATYNAFADSGSDLEFGRSFKTLKPISNPTFYGYRVRNSGRDAKVSIAVDEDCRVLDRDGWVIPGVYAVGAAITYATRGDRYVGSGGAIASGCATSIIAGRHSAVAATRDPGFR